MIPRSLRHYACALGRRRRDERVAHHRDQGVDKFRPGVEGLRAAQVDSMFARKRHRLDVDVVEDLEVVGDEADRAHQRPPHISPGQRIEQVWTEPRLAGVAGGLKRELPFRQGRPFRDQPAALQEPFAIGIPRRFDASGQAVGSEEDPFRLEINERLRE